MDFSANSSIEYPLYLSTPSSPFKKVIALSHEPVFLNPRSNVIRPDSPRNLLISNAFSFSDPVTIGSL